LVASSEKEIFSLSELYISLAAVGGLLLLLGVLGGLLKERTPVSEPLIALLAGVLIGQAALGLLDLAKPGNETLILEEAALVTLGVALVGVALRLPAVLALRRLLGPLCSRDRNVLFLGWFGPIGAALYYAAFSLRETGIEEVWVVGSLVICASVLIHGVSATPLTKLYGRLPQGR
jgi:NhaP-type Na+/H+ or K+/H+ antiporter